MTLTFPGTSLRGLLLRSADAYREKTAVEIAKRQISYGELFRTADLLAIRINEAAPCEEVRVALLAEPGLVGCVGVLATLLAGGVVIPLNPKFPALRLRQMLIAARPHLLLIQSGWEQAGYDLADTLDAQIGSLVINFETANVVDAKAARQQHMPKPLQRPPHDSGKGAFVLFTSGSSGAPKGVQISDANVMAYLTNLKKEAPLNSTDRVSHNFELTFDLGIHDLLSSWASGACVCIPSAADRFAPLRYIENSGLTVFFCVPSLAAAVMGGLLPGSLPGLRLSLFCGEPLLDRVATAWSSAANSSSIINLYGPTETTIAISAFHWSVGNASRCSARGIVNIGRVFSNHRFLILQANGRKCSPGQRGELLIAGPQVASGYLTPEGAPERAFVQLQDELWYRTGDVVRQNQEGYLEFWGRMDDQIKIAGYRIELGEIEHHLRAISGADSAAAVTAYAASGRDVIVAFVESAKHLAEDDILSALQERLPHYMLPATVRFIEAFPKNANGKIDKTRLRIWAASLVR